MSDLISRQAAIDALFELYEHQRAFDPTEAADLVRQGIYLAEKKIEQLPSAEPEIIRCKECKHYIAHDKRCGYWNHGVSLDWWDEWCSHGERRGDG